MITITRSLARQFRAVLRSMRIGKSHGEVGKTIVLQACSNVLRIVAASYDAAVEYRQSGSFEDEELTVPLDLLETCEGRKNEPVTLEAREKDKVLASWSDRGIPQMVEVNAPKLTAGCICPPMPESFSSNPPDLWLALRDAATCTDRESQRYALSCLQLRGGQGKIVATDGKQILVQSGFSFPWQDDILVPGSGVFACRELPSNDQVAVGALTDWLTLSLGNWTIWLRIDKEGRFPKVEELIRPTASALSRLAIAPGDAEFLAQALPRLPSNDAIHSPITLDLNGRVLVRGKPEGSGRTTELVLSNSHVQGEPIVLNTNREYLGRAVRFGFRELAVFGNEAPVQCEEGQRQYVWALLNSQDVIPACDDALRIESPVQAASAQTNSSQPTRRRFTVTHPPTSSETTSPAATNRADNKPALDENSGSPIAQAMALRAMLLETLSQTSELIRALKRQKRQSRLLSSTLASLKELQKVAS